MKTILSFVCAAILSGSLMAQKPIELKYNLEQGKAYRAKSVSVQDQTTTMQGMERNSEVTSTVYFSIKPLNAKEDFFMAEARFDTIINSNTMPPMSINSSKPGNIDSENPVDVIQEVMHRFSKVPLVVKMDYTGHVIDILNYNLITSSVLVGLDSLKGQAMMAKAQIELMMNKEAIKGMIESITASLPNKEVKKKDTWESSFVSSAGGIGMEIKSKCTLKDITNEVATVGADVNIDPVDGKPLMMNGAEITNEIRGLGKSDSKYDVNTGWIISTTSNMQMKGEMHVKAQGQEMNIPLEIKMTAETTAIE